MHLYSIFQPSIHQRTVYEVDVILINQVAIPVLGAAAAWLSQARTESSRAQRLLTVPVCDSVKQLRLMRDQN